MVDSEDDQPEAEPASICFLTVSPNIPRNGTVDEPSHPLVYSREPRTRNYNDLRLSLFLSQDLGARRPHDRVHEDIKTGPTPGEGTPSLSLRDVRNDNHGTRYCATQCCLLGSAVRPEAACCSVHLIPSHAQGFGKRCRHRADGACADSEQGRSCSRRVCGSRDSMVETSCSIRVPLLGLLRCRLE